MIPALSQPEKDPRRILAVRAEIADEIVALDRTPLLLVETEPAAGSLLVDGPIAIEVRGVVEPGTTVAVGGSPARVLPDGTFAGLADPRGERGEVRIEARRDGKTRTVVRTFEVRR